MRKGCAAVKTIEHEHGRMFGVCGVCAVCVHGGVGGGWWVVYVGVCVGVGAGVGVHAENEKVSESTQGA